MEAACRMLRLWTRRALLATARCPPYATAAAAVGRRLFALIQRLLESTKARLELVAGVEQMADSLTKLGASEVDLIETLNKGKFFN